MYKILFIFALIIDFLMKRIAYIISAYTDPNHLKRLVERLSVNSDFYVHIDKKIDITPFKKALADKVQFVPRYWISWGGWSQVLYQEELLKAVFNSGKDYSHIVCLSGLDYPMWNPERIVSFFNENPTKEFIAGFDMTSGHLQYPYYTKYHFFRDLKCNSQWWKDKLIVASRWFMKPLCHKPPYAPIDGKQCDIYKGSDYWAITPDCAKLVLEKLSQQPLRNYFKYSFVPSEMCLQTIIFNSPFRENAILHTDKYPGLPTLTPLHFIDYHGFIKHLDESDYPRLKESGRMFCRKVVSGKSDSLVEIINKA